ncbi:MAG: hypothetical protein ACYC99_06900 [Candidatus Geothermincolia bacterium]
MKKPAGIKEIYRSIRKPMAPPTRQEPDEREDLKGRDARREMDEYRGSRGRRKAGRNDS